MDKTLGIKWEYDLAPFFFGNTHGQIILVFPRRYIFVNDAVVFFILEDQSNPSTHPPSHFENSEKHGNFSGQPTFVSVNFQQITQIETCQPFEFIHY